MVFPASSAGATDRERDRVVPWGNGRDHTVGTPPHLDPDASVVERHLYRHLQLRSVGEPLRRARQLAGGLRERFTLLSGQNLSQFVRMARDGVGAAHQRLPTSRLVASPVRESGGSRLHRSVELASGTLGRRVERLACGRINDLKSSRGGAYRHGT